jgi:hypothetical protein
MSPADALGTVLEFVQFPILKSQKGYLTGIPEEANGATFHVVSCLTVYTGVLTDYR